MNSVQNKPRDIRGVFCFAIAKLPHCETFVTGSDTLLSGFVPNHSTRFVTVFFEWANLNAFAIFQIIQFALVHTRCDFAFLDITADRHSTICAVLVFAFAALFCMVIGQRRVAGISWVALRCDTFAPTIDIMIPFFESDTIFNIAWLDIRYTCVRRNMVTIFAFFYHTRTETLFVKVPCYFGIDRVWRAAFLDIIFATIAIRMISRRTHSNLTYAAILV